MAFDIGNGLSAAGAAVEKTAGAYTLEQQRAELDQDKIKLADQLAGVREEKGRQFTTSERVATQGFTSGENVLNRDNAVKLANIGADAAVKAAGIHAGGTVAAAQIGATSHLAGIDKQIEANKPLITEEVLTKSIANTNAKELQDARSAVGKARETGDPAAIKAAQQRVYDAEYSSHAQVQQASLYQAQAKIAETAVTSLQTRLVALQDPMKQMNPESKALAETLTGQLKRAQAEYDTALRMAQDAVKNLPSYNPPTAGATAPGVIQYDAKGNRVTGAPTATTPPPTVTPGPGLINQPVSP